MEVAETVEAAESAASANPDNSDLSSPPKNQMTQVKARGTYFPLTSFPTNMPQGPVMRRDASPNNIDKEEILGKQDVRGLHVDNT